jgi:hypothetical protein
MRHAQGVNAAADLLQQDAADGGVQHRLVCCFASLSQTRKALVLQA